MELFTNRQRTRLPGWFVAPILGGVIGILVGTFTLIVHWHESEIANVNRQEIRPYLLLMSGAMGMLAGLILWCRDTICGREKKLPIIPAQPLQYVFIHDRRWSSHRIPPGLIVHNLAPSPPGEYSSTMQRVGRRLIGFCILSLLLGRPLVALVFPEFCKGELTLAKLAVLIPIWSTGIIGLVLLIAGTIHGHANAKRTASNPKI